MIVNDLRMQGLGDNKVPRVIKPIEEITKMNFSPNEGFMLSRIKETYERTHDNTLAVAEGLEKTAGLITSAARMRESVKR